MSYDPEQAFKKMEQDYYNKQASSAHSTVATGLETVLFFLLEHPNKIWWWSWEFVSQTTRGGGWLSHRAPARASDLAIHYPELVEHRKIGRYKVYRLRVENMKEIYKFLGL